MYSKTRLVGSWRKRNLGESEVLWSPAKFYGYNELSTF